MPPREAQVQVARPRRFFQAAMVGGVFLQSREFFGDRFRGGFVTWRGPRESRFRFGHQLKLRLWRWRLRWPPASPDPVQP